MNDYIRIIKKVDTSIGHAPKTCPHCQVTAENLTQEAGEGTRISCSECGGLICHTYVGTGNARGPIVGDFSLAYARMRRMQHYFENLVDDPIKRMRILRTLGLWPLSTLL